MQVQFTNTRNKHLPLLIVLSACTGLIGVLCLIFHLSPEKISAQLAEFACHHYLLVGFFSLVISLILAQRLDASTKGGEQRVLPSSLRYRSPKHRRKLRQAVTRMMQRFQLKSDMAFVSNKEILQVGIQPQEVLSTPEEQEKRLQDLKHALLVTEKQKLQVAIHYLDGQSKKYTIANLWHVDDENVCLSGGAVLPIKNIYKINY
jgi:hypothetical protein